MPVFFLAAANDFSSGDIQRSKERGGAVAVVIMGSGAFS
jgi:hypothetical protein